MSSNNNNHHNRHEDSEVESAGLLRGPGARRQRESERLLFSSLPRAFAAAAAAHRSTDTMPLEALPPADVKLGASIPNISSTEMVEQLLAQLRTTIDDGAATKDAAAASSVGDDGTDNKDREIEEVDLVISGGGLKGFFVTGAWAVLREIDGKLLRIKRMAGASVGACCAVYMACGIDPVRWSQTYRATAMAMQSGKSLVEAFYHVTRDLLPDNAHELCNGRVFISITVLAMTGPKNIIVSQFGTTPCRLLLASERSRDKRASRRRADRVDAGVRIAADSKEDVLMACLASSNIPFFTASGFGRTFRGMRVLDGGVTNNTPIFTDSTRRQIVFRLFQVAYPSSLALTTSDPCIEALILRGAMQMRLFIQGEYAGENSPIRWYRTSAEEIQAHGFKLRQLSTTKLTGLVALLALVGSTSSFTASSHIVRGYVAASSATATTATDLSLSLSLTHSLSITRCMIGQDAVSTALDLGPLSLAQVLCVREPVQPTGKGWRLWWLDEPALGLRQSLVASAVIAAPSVWLSRCLVVRSCCLSVYLFGAMLSLRWCCCCCCCCCCC